MHATKVFGVGEGGAVFVRDSLADRVRRTVNFGLRDDGVPAVPGFNGKLSEVHAAIGLAVLERIDDFLERRAQVARRYRVELTAVDLEHPPHAGAPPWQTYPVALPRPAEPIARQLVAAGVGVRRYYAPPLHLTSPYASDARLPVTEDLAERMLCLPVYSDMRKRELREILASVSDALSPAKDAVA